MKSAHIKQSCVASLVMLSSLAAPGSADARTLAPSAGRAIEPQDEACFRLQDSSVVNVCNGTKGFEIALAVDTEGPRLPAIVEQFQRPDRSVAVPKVRQKWLGKDSLRG